MEFIEIVKNILIGMMVLGAIALCAVYFPSLLIIICVVLFCCSVEQG